MSEKFRAGGRSGRQIYNGFKASTYISSHRILEWSSMLLRCLHRCPSRLNHSSLSQWRSLSSKSGNSSKPYYITTPIFYPNAGESVLCISELKCEVFCLSKFPTSDTSILSSLQTYSLVTNAFWNRPGLSDS